MNSADVFTLEFDLLTRTSSLAKILERFRNGSLGAGTHRQLLLELNHVINVHSRLREVAADVVPPEDWSAWQDLLSVPALAFEQGRSFLDDLRSLGLNALDSVSLTPLPQTIALAAYAHYQLVERATVGLVGYLWFFERMPRLLYPLWAESCRRGAVPEKALHALTEGALDQIRHVPSGSVLFALPGSELTALNAFYEQLVFDATGQLLNASFMDFLLPTALDVPRVEVGHEETTSPLNPLGTKGAGEAGAIPVGALFAQTVENALAIPGLEILEIPLKPSRLWELAREASS
jgi:hypothetical protein